jgi:hypothetical protein
MYREFLNPSQEPGQDHVPVCNGTQTGLSQLEDESPPDLHVLVDAHDLPKPAIQSQLNQTPITDRWNPSHQFHHPATGTGTGSDPSHLTNQPTNQPTHTPLNAVFVWPCENGHTVV